MAVVFLGIGSNMGDRRKHIDNAVDLLEKQGVVILARSSLIETDSVGGPPQGPFLNGVLKVQTALEPEPLLKCLKSIETTLGRVPTVRNGPRPVDMDILLYDNISMQTPTLTIPHPRMRDRDFVMRPLNEILAGAGSGAGQRNGQI